MKNIYLEPNEEIISVVDRLIQAENGEVNLVVPSGAQIWQSSINLKLLKREADNLNKLVTLIVTDDLGAEMAEKIGFKVKRERDLPVELVKQQTEEVPAEESEEIVIEEPTSQPKEDMIDLLVDGLESDKKEKKTFASLASWGKKSTQKRMADIVIPVDKGKTKLFRRSSPKEPLVSKEPINVYQPVSEERVLSRSAKPTGLKWSKFFIFFIIIAVITAGFVGYLILPNAKVNIAPKTELVTFDLSVIGSGDISQIDEALNKIPLQEVEVTKTKSREFNTTGEEEINQKARGLITVYNEYSSEKQTLLARTRFESSSGKVFRILQSVTVPGAKIEEGKIIPSTLEVEIVADQPGEDYNISADDFTIPGFKGSPKFAGFYGKSSDSMTGGFVGKAKVVLADDLEKAESILTDELKEEVDQAITEQIPTDLRIIKNGLKEETAEVSSSVKRGERADNFTLEVEMTIRALLFKEEDLKNLVDLNLISKVSNDKIPIQETQKISWPTPDIDWSEGKVSFLLSVEENVAWQIDIQSLKENLINLDEVAVRKYLANQSEIEKATVSFWPFWVKKMPNQEKKIEVNIGL